MEEGGAVRVTPLDMFDGLAGEDFFGISPAFMSIEQVSLPWLERLF